MTGIWNEIPQERGLKIEWVSISESKFLKCLSCPFHSIYHTSWHYHFCKWGGVSSGASRLKWHQKGWIILSGFFYRLVNCHFNANHNILAFTSMQCTLQMRMSGKFCPFYVSWYMFDSLPNVPILDRLWSILFFYM